jgi:hypothetical protein
MLNLAFLFDDAIQALTVHPERVQVPPLPAAVHLMQVDVINHYRYALNNNFTLFLQSPTLQNSSLGSPYQKWAFFTNKYFEMFSFAVHNLLRYTARLAQALLVEEPNDELRAWQAKDCLYIDLKSELARHQKPVGIFVHEDNTLTLTALIVDPPQGLLMATGKIGEPAQYHVLEIDETGREVKKPITKEEFKARESQMRPKRIDIGDRTILNDLQARGMAEIQTLVERNQKFAAACNTFYESRKPSEPFSSLFPACYV